MALSSLDGWLIALAFVAAYIVVVLVLRWRRRIGPERSISLYGPALMLKTRRGRGLLERLGRFRRFWGAAGDLGIVLAAVAMVSIVAVLIYDAILASQIPAGAAPSPAEALGIPGLNPIIPIGYGLVALIVGVVVHELLHGVLARSQNIPVKSLGILWLVIPIGAFVEQDDEAMNQAPRRKRDRVAAAGILANFALAVGFFVVLSALLFTSVAPNATGIGVVAVVAGSPAANASIQVGSIITSINHTATPDGVAISRALEQTHPGQTVQVTFTRPSSTTIVTTNATLASLASYTNDPADANRGFLGVSRSFLTPAELQTILTDPLASHNGARIGATEWLILPLAGLEPVEGVPNSFYHLTGPLAFADPGVLWILANVLYWLAWMNLLLGLSNALPVFPLDGGLLFRDFAAGLASRVRKNWDRTRLDRFAGRAVALTSVIVVLLFVWQFVAPRF